MASGSSPSQRRWSRPRARLLLLRRKKRALFTLVTGHLPRPRRKYGTRRKTRAKTQQAVFERSLRARLAPGQHFWDAAGATVDDIRAAVGCFAAKPSVEVFGSLLQGTSIDGSDVDVRMVFGAVGRSQAVRYLQLLMKALYRPPASRTLRLVEAILTAKVPILRVRSLRQGSCIHADVSVGGSQQGACDVAVHDVLECDVRARDLVRLVKHWARQRGLNKAYHGYPSSFSWVLLAIFYLQQLGMLPPVNRRKDVWKRLRNPPGLQELLRNFLVFCRQIQYGCGMSVTTGKFMPKEDAVLFIEVPCEKGKNAARSVRFPQWREVKSHASDTVSTLDSQEGYVWSILGEQKLRDPNVCAWPSESESPDVPNGRGQKRPFHMASSSESDTKSLDSAVSSVRTTSDDLFV